MARPIQTTLRAGFSELFSFVDDEECGLGYEPVFREFFLIVRADAPVTQQIHFCPFSGKALPPSLRHKFFDILEAQGWRGNIFELDTAPDEFQSERWWLDRNF